MVFSSIEFLFFFLPVVLIGYYLLKRWRRAAKTSPAVRVKYGTVFRDYSLGKPSGISWVTQRRPSLVQMLPRHLVQPMHLDSSPFSRTL